MFCKNDISLAKNCLLFLCLQKFREQLLLFSSADLKVFSCGQASLPSKLSDGNPQKLQKADHARPKLVGLKVNTKASVVTPAKRISASIAESNLSEKLVKASNKKLTDGTISWDCLSSSLVTLGKEVLQRRDAASLAAAEALKDASASESIIRGLSMFSELCSLAKPDNPQPSVEQFLDLQQILVQATDVVDALVGMENFNRKIDEPESTPIISDELQNLFAEKASRASLWIGAALSTDLAAFSLMMKQAGSVTTKKSAKKDVTKGGTSGNQATLVLEQTSGLKTGAMPWASTVTSLPSSSKKIGTPVISSSLNKGSPSSVFQIGNDKRRNAGCDVGETKQNSSVKVTTPATRRLINGSSKAAGAKFANKSGLDTPCQGSPVVINWVKGGGLQETAELAKKLQNESQSWFLKFMEAALDSDCQLSNGIESTADSATTKPCPQQDGSQIAAMLSQLKRVNDWLDQVNAGKEEMVDTELVETLARLKRKMYDFLLKHVDSAASALGNQANL